MSRTSSRIALLAVLLIVAAALPAAAEDGRYLIRFKDFRNAPAAVLAVGGSPVYSFPELATIAAWLPEQAVVALAKNPVVEFIEVDEKRYLTAEATPYGITMVQADQVAFASAATGSCRPAA
jgi:serine protease